MKKLTSLAFMICLLLGVQEASAQFKGFVWKDFGVQFSIPNSHKVIQNSADAFESGDETTWLELYPYRDAAATPEAMIEAVANEKGVKILEEGTQESNGYEGYWITCEDSNHPEWLYYYIGFIDPESDVNFYAIIWYKKGNKAAEKTALDMSFKFSKAQ